MGNSKLETSNGVRNATNAIIDYFRANAPLIAQSAKVPWSETAAGGDIKSQTPEWIQKMAEGTIVHWNTISETQYENQDRLTDKEATQVREVVSVYLRNGEVGDG